MHEYAQVLKYAIPGFIVLMIIEYLISLLMKNEVFRSFDTISSISSGITNALKDILELSVVVIGYSWFYNHFHFYKMESNIWAYVLAFVGLDFAGYWSHRFEHTINVFWNRHIIHHSSEEFNLACALRQNISAILVIFTFLLIPCALLGVEPKVIQIIAPLHLFAQFWYHTRLINKMGFLEYVIVTPSHHRVHHAINDIYIDKNYSQIFIFWDKLFGTFQPELAEEPPVYGVKKAASTWNPVWINFSHISQIISDAIRTSSIQDKLRIWFMPTGWRPQDVALNYPINLVPYREQVKYDTDGSKFFHLWSWIHLAITLGGLIYLCNVIAQFDFVYILYFSLFLFLSIYANTALMDRERNHAVIAELLRMAVVFGICYHLGSFMGLSSLITAIFCSVSFCCSLLLK
jgi:alkylglycerol monooxygenase